ncbi:hypothetical protein T265_14938, partial [Opisthorchis viverrini]
MLDEENSEDELNAASIGLFLSGRVLKGRFLHHMRSSGESCILPGRRKLQNMYPEPTCKPFMIAIDDGQLAQADKAAVVKPMLH